MTQEEKAKRYDEVINILKGFMRQDADPFLTKADALNYLPELAESEDEKIRKAVIYGMHALKSQHKTCFASIPIDNIITWLEKQDKKVKPIEGFNTEFKRQISHFIASVINKEHEYNEGYVKWVSNALLNYAKHDFFEQDKQKQDPCEHCNNIKLNCTNFPCIKK